VADASLFLWLFPAERQRGYLLVFNGYHFFRQGEDFPERMLDLGGVDGDHHVGDSSVAGGIAAFADMVGDNIPEVGFRPHEDVSFIGVNDILDFRSLAALDEILGSQGGRPQGVAGIPAQGFQADKDAGEGVPSPQGT